MSNSTADRDDAQVEPEIESHNPAVSVLLAIRRSFLLFVAVVGLVLIGIGVLLDGIFAGMFGIWGATGLVCAGLGYVAVQMLKIFDV